MLVSEDWRSEMMKNLDRPETFSNKIFKTLSSKISKKEDVYKSIIVVKYHVAS